MVSRHDWNSWENYQAVHYSYVSNYEDYFVTRDELVPNFAPFEVIWEGVLYCVDGIEIHVFKRQEVQYRQGRPYVRTQDYSYHVLRRRGSRVTHLFRYDNVDQKPGHSDAHHYHQFDAYGVEVACIHIGAEQWPVLSEVIDEAMKY